MGWKRSHTEKERLFKLFKNTGGNANRYLSSRKVFFNIKRGNFQRIYNTKLSTYYKKYSSKKARRLLKHEDIIRFKSNDYIKATGLVGNYWW